MSVDGRKSIKVGSVIDGRYRLDEVIGSGTMGQVYLATQLTVNRKVAVKILNASVKNHPKLQQRFEIEARAVASVNHPNVLTLFDLRIRWRRMFSTWSSSTSTVRRYRM